MTEVSDIVHCLDMWSQIAQAGNAKNLPYIVYSQSDKSAESRNFFRVRPRPE